MSDVTRITARPQMRDQAGTPELRPAAQMHGFAVANIQPNRELVGLINGLSAFNPALTQMEQDQKEEWKNTALANSQKVEQPRDALTGEPTPIPENVPRAYGRLYQATYNEGLAQRVAIDNKADIARKYHDLKNSPDFDPAAFLAQERQAALAGIADPRAQAIIGQHFSQLEGDVQADVEGRRVQQISEANKQTFNSMLTDAVSGVDTPAQAHTNFGVLQERGVALGISRAEATQALMFHLVGKSNSMGGAPELFEMFNEKDASGKTLLDYNPGLAQHIQQAKEHAQHLRDKDLDEKAMATNAQTLAKYEDDIANNPASVTMERLINDMTPHGAVRSPQDAAHKWSRAQEALRKQQATLLGVEMFHNGELWRLEPGKQNQIMDAQMGGAMEVLAQASKSGDTAAVGAVADQVLRMHSQSGATVPFDQLKNYLSHFVTTSPSKSGPTPGFMAVAELYKAMSAAPKYRDYYFNEDISHVIEAYNGALRGSPPDIAYAQAYQSTSPEAKAAGEAYIKTPEFQKILNNEAEKWVAGSSMDWLKIFGKAGRPTNMDVIGKDLEREMKGWRSKNPYMSTKAGSQYAERWLGENYVIDGSTGAAVKVPSGYSSPAVQQAISEHSSNLTKEMSLGDRSDAKWGVEYLPEGTEGMLRPVLTNGMDRHPLQPVSIQQLLDNSTARNKFTSDESAQLGALRTAVQEGKPIPNIDTKLLAKAELLGGFKISKLGIERSDTKTIAAIRAASEKQMLEQINSVPQISMGKVSFDNLQFIPTKGTTKVDNSLTAQVSRDFFTSQAAGLGGVHMDYAASLISMGEGVVLRAYDDPARGAGKNIGMGYNLNANANTARSDLKRAMVPEDQIEGVINGTASLTPDQAKRLLTVVALPRYEKQVRDVAESTHPGLWNRMKPEQKAVMIDIAWQTGNPDKYKKAWRALASRNDGDFSDEIKSFYTDQGGARKEDTRRGNLRAAMLSGVAQWQAVVERFGSIPSSKLAALK